MAEYKYIATNEEGVVHTGTMLAENEEDVEVNLEKDNLILVNLKLIPDAKESFLDGILHGVSSNDKAQFLEYFASMLEAGLSVSDVLQAFYEDLDKPRLRKFVKDTQYGVRNGKKLSECFEDYPDMFPKLYSGMIKVGEASGTLAQSLRHLANQLKKTNELNAKVKNAMIYPVILVIALFFVITVLLLVVFPRIEGFFTDAGLELPPLTLALLSLSQLISNNLLIVVMLLVAAFFGYKRANKNPKFRLFKSKLILRLPILGPLNRAINVAVFARTFGSLLASGVNILEAVEVVRVSLGNQVYADIMAQMKEDIAVGNTIADIMQKYPKNFSPFEIRVLSISERTGQVATGLQNIAEFYESKLYNLLAGLSSTIEPLLLIFMGGIVAVIAISVITPIYQLLADVSTI